MIKIFHNPLFLCFIFIAIGTTILIVGNLILTPIYTENINACNTCFAQNNVSKQCNLTWKIDNITGERYMELPQECIDLAKERCNTQCPLIETTGNGWVK